MKSLVARGLILLACLLSIPVGVALADHIGQGINLIPFLVTNGTGADAEDVQVPFTLSSQTLIDLTYMDADALNTDVQEGSEHRGYMPGTGRVQMLSCFDNAGVDETVDCNDAGSSDITLPATGSEVFEFAADNQFRHLHINIGTAAVADWTIVWEYWNGSSYVALSNVTDGTDGFETVGTNRVTWDFPAAGLWPESTLHAVVGYWVRARVSVFTSVTTPPLGTQAWYETGRWWTLAESIGATEQKRFDTHLDIAPSAAVDLTFPVAASSNDGVVSGSDSAYPPPFGTASTTGTAVSLHRTLSGATYTVSNVLLRFDTSSIPDSATVTAATLRCTMQTAADADGRSLLWEWYDWSSLTGANYINFAPAVSDQAHTGTPLANFGTLQEWSLGLNNLININKNGFTGLRAHVSGGVPSGINRIDIYMEDDTVQSPCSIDVTYSPDKNYHLYFPHTDGYTLSDAAISEPGDTFQIDVVGFWDSQQGAGKNIVAKGTDLQMRWSASADDTLVIVQNGVAVINANIGSGYRKLTLTQGGVDTDDRLTLLSDGTKITEVAAATINDNASDWTFFQGGSTAYMEYMRYERGQTLQILHQIQDLPGLEIEDQSSNGDDAIARYPDTIAGFTVSLQSAETTTPTGGAQPEPGPEVMGDVPAIEGFTDIPAADSDSFWLFQLIGQAAPTAGLYTYFVVFIGIGMTIGVTVLAARWFKAALIVGVVAIVMLVVFWLMGILPGWLPWLFGLGPVLFFLIWKRLSP